MNKMSNQAAYQGAIHMIEEQLRALPVSLAMLLHPDPANAASPELIENLAQLHQRRRQKDTGSVGNIVASRAKPDSALDFKAAAEAMSNNPKQKNNCIRTVIGNALLAVGMFFEKHDMAAMRTPEIQFLDHVCDAILNENRFTIEQGYIPIATFDGLVIDSKLDGSLLFGDETSEGFMEFGDAIALLQWLSRYLRGERHFVTGGDAG